jgi:outer membrane protein TolC
MCEERKLPWRPRRKNRYFAIFIAFITVFLATPSSNAQESESRVLKLEKAITLALNADNEVAVAGNELAKAKLAVDLEKINALPAASGNASVADYCGDTDQSRNLQLKVQQTIPTKWRLYGVDEATDVETKRWTVTKDEAALQIARAETVYDVTKLYFSVLKAQKTVEYQRLAVDYARKKAEYNKLQLKYGKVTRTTQLTAENDYTTACYELEKDQQAFYLALKKLASQIGFADYLKITLDRTLLAAAPVKIDYQQQKQRALLNRPEIRQYQMELKTAEQELAVAKNSGLPSLNLSYQNRGQLQSFDARYDLLSGDLTWSTAWQKDYSDDDDDSMETFNSKDMFGTKRKKIGLTLSWDLDFGSAANEVKQAFYSLESARSNVEQSAKDIALEIDEAISAYESAWATLDNSRAGIPLYEKTLELAKLQAKMGMMTAIDLKKAELDLDNAKNDVAAAICDLLIAAKKLQLELGLLYDVE